MLQWQVVVTLLCACFSNAHKAEKYIMGYPEIEVINHKRFQFSIEDKPGIEFVAFHANINAEIELNAPGTYMEELSRPVHGRWTWTCDLSQFHLHTNDKINYWYFVNHNRMGITRAGTYTVQNIPDLNTEHSNQHSQYATNTSRAPSTQQTTKNTSNETYEELLVNLTRTIIKQQIELETLEKTNKQLTNFFEKYPNAKKVHISGRIPSDGDAYETVRFIIYEKLDLNPQIVSSVRNADKSIVFEVANLDEKLAILQAAKEKLDNSNIVLSEYEDTNCCKDINNNK